MREEWQSEAKERGRKEVVPGFRAEAEEKRTSLLSIRRAAHDVLGFGNVQNDVWQRYAASKFHSSFNLYCLLFINEFI